MRHIWILALLSLAACEEKKDTAQTPPSVQPSAATTGAVTTAAAPATTPSAAPAATPSTSASAAPVDNSQLDGAAILARMGTAVCKALDKCEPATVKSLGGLEKCGKVMSTSPPPGFNKKTASCKASELSACLKVYERDSVCADLKENKKKKNADPPECALCGIK